MNKTSLSGYDAFLVGVIASCLKLLISIPAYRSTDFEVHRNWLAITHTLPVKDWYFESTSQWTLDYPPLFAYFEYLLSIIAYHIDPLITTITATPYESVSCIVFQRASVIVVDSVLLTASYRFMRSSGLYKSSNGLAVYCLIAFHSALIMVDHIHFQYNGMLIGILISVLDFAYRKQYMCMAVAFSILVCMKHLFLALVPLFAVYLLRTYCNLSYGSFNFQYTNFVKLVIVAIAVLLLTFGPFVFQNDGIAQLSQIASRLFPFGRGLVHAYWAPNVWAIYYACDKVLYKMLNLLHAHPIATGFSAATAEEFVSSTSGLVGEYVPLVLVKIPATATILLTFVSMIPFLYRVALTPTPRTLVTCTVNCLMSSFMLGYHVHEKAILVPLILQIFISIDDVHSFNTSIVNTAVGMFSLFPLLFTRQEVVTKALLSLLWILFAYSSHNVHTYDSSKPKHAYSITTSNEGISSYLVYIVIILLYIFNEIIHPIYFVDVATGAQVMEFLPLILTSTFCALYNVITWLSMYVSVFDKGTSSVKERID